MAVQKNKTSKQRKHTRAANWKISAPNLSECPNCGELKVSHKVCPNCGSPIVIKRGRFGEFKACSAYPKCKTIIK